MKKICFLCHGNICRSPMAEFVMKKLLRDAGIEDVVVESAALHTDEIGSDIHYGTRGKLVEEGIAFSPRRAWLMTAAKAREYDLLIGCDSYNIADPWYTGNFDQTFEDVMTGCKALLQIISSSLKC